MDFGIFSLINRREQSTPIPRLLAETLEQVKAAEAARFGTAWFTEHHFSNYSLTPSPLIMVAAAAPITRTIRLGTAVILGCLYQPARLLGEIGFADNLSNGRLIVGVGTGYQAHELARFGVSLEQSRGLTEELLDILEMTVHEPSVEFHGKHFDLPLTHISVRPVRPEGVPIWLAGNSPPSLAIAAQRGYPLFASGFGRDISTLKEVRQGAEAIWKAEGKHTSDLKFATLRYCYVSDSKAEALHFAENARYQMRQSKYLRKGQLTLDSAFLPEEPFADEMTPEELMAWNPIGDAETVAEKLVAEIRAVNPHHIGLYMTMGSTPHSGAMASIERFGTRVLPLIERELGPLARLAA